MLGIAPQERFSGQIRAITPKISSYGAKRPSNQRHPASARCLCAWM